MWVQKVTLCGNSLVVTLNREVLQKTGLKKGDYVKVSLDNGKIVIEPLRE